MAREHILFVDDEQAVLDGFRRMLHPMHDQWHMDFAPNGRTALDMMAKDTYDVIISDMQMPGMNGAELLGKVKECYPQVIRIVLSGQSDISALPQMLRVAHQFLSKPVESKRLIFKVSRARALKDMLRDDALSKLILRMEALPSHPSLYIELRDELSILEPSTQKVGDIVSRDMGLTLKVLQIINSGFFPTHRPVLDPRLMVDALGINTIMDIADLTTVLPERDRALSTLPPLGDLWEHSRRAGKIARAIARAESINQEITDEAYLAAFMHDIGKIILTAHLPDKYAIMLSLVEARGMPQSAAEKQVFDSVHSDVGAFLLALWGMPASIFIPVACHDDPNRCQDSQQMVRTAIVHTANIFEHAATTGEWQDVEDHLNMEFLDKLDLKERLPIWQEVSQSLINSKETNDVG